MHMLKLAVAASTGEGIPGQEEITGYSLADSVRGLKAAAADSAAAEEFQRRIVEAINGIPDADKRAEYREAEKALLEAAGIRPHQSDAALPSIDTSLGLHMLKLAVAAAKGDGLPGNDEIAGYTLPDSVIKLNAAALNPAAARIFRSRMNDVIEAILDPDKRAEYREAEGALIEAAGLRLVQSPLAHVAGKPQVRIVIPTVAAEKEEPKPEAKRYRIHGLPPAESEETETPQAGEAGVARGFLKKIGLGRKGK